MGKMMLYAMISVFFIELALHFVGAGIAHTALFNALTQPKSAYLNVLIFGGIAIIFLIGLGAVVTPGFIYQINQWALFAGAVAVIMTWIVVYVDFWNFLQSQITSFGVDFAGLIATVVTAPLILLFFLAGLEWTRFNQ